MTLPSSVENPDLRCLVVSCNNCFIVSFMLSNGTFKDHWSTNGTCGVSHDSLWRDHYCIELESLTAKFSVLNLLQNASRLLESSPQMFAFHAISTHHPFDIQTYNHYTAVSYSNNNKMHTPHALIEYRHLKKWGYACYRPSVTGELFIGMELRKRQRNQIRVLVSKGSFDHLVPFVINFEWLQFSNFRI